MFRNPACGRRNRRTVGRYVPILTAILLFSLLLSPASAGHEHTYVAALQTSLVDAADHLQRARLALHQCLADNESCARDPQPLLFEVFQAKLGLETMQARLRGLDVPAKYTQVHILAIEGLMDISFAMDLLAEGIQNLDPAPIELASVYMDESRQKIEEVYQRLAELPPQEDLGLYQYLWPLVAVMVTLVALNVMFSLRSVGRTRFTRKARSSVCPFCGQEMRDWRSYPVKVVKGWMNRHIETFHSEDG